MNTDINDLKTPPRLVIGKRKSEMIYAKITKIIECDSPKSERTYGDIQEATERPQVKHRAWW